MENNSSETTEKRTILWSCGKPDCNTYHVRVTKLAWETGVLQSPCPACGQRTRLNEGNTRSFESKEDALNAKELLLGRWL